MRTPRFLSFWSINAAITPDLLRTELERLAEHGLDGVVFHPRYYPGNPDYLSDAYLEVVSDAILAARDLGLAFWIYDENGWPSGTADGMTLRTYPQLAKQWLGLFPGPGTDPLARFDHRGHPCHLAVQAGPGVDYLSADLGQRFVELTYERYRTGLAPEAFDHVEAFFADEPEFGTAHMLGEFSPEAIVPWSGRLEAEFERRHGVPLRPRLPALFVDGPDSADVRRAFWELCSDLLADGFLAPIDRWCRQHGKRFAAHVKGEESPLFQVFTSGCAETAFHRMGLPGVDALERYPGNNYYPRQASTASRQFGDGRTMAEAFGGSGWGGGPADLEAYVGWLASHGITDIVFHLSQLRLDSPALFDWPPSHPLHVTWAPAYATVLERLRTELAEPRPAADTLIVSPHRAVMETVQPWEFGQTNLHHAKTHPDSVAGRVSDRFLELVETAYRRGIRYDVVSERTLEAHGRVAASAVTIGAQTYRAVVLSPDARVAPDVREALERTGLLRQLQDLTEQAGTEPAPAVADSPAFSVAPRWTQASHPVNELPLTAASDEGWCAASFRSVLESGCPVELVFADDVAELTVNGAPVATPAGRDGSRAVIDLPAGTAETTVQFRVAHEAPLAFCWVRGRFLARSATPYLPAEQDNQVVTEGPFELTDPELGFSSPDLLASGYPFLRRPLLVETHVRLPEPARQLRISGHIADAARVRVDGVAGAWQWGEDVSVAGDFAAGEHRVEVELIPNSFNVFGPHHYRRGDAPVISPDQIAGVRNLMDLDLPPRTHEDRWHLRCFALPTALSASR